MCLLLFWLLMTDCCRRQYSEGSATGNLDTAFSWFPSATKQMLRWFPKFKVITTCFSCSPPLPPPDLNFLVTSIIFCIRVKEPLPLGDNPIVANKYYYYYFIVLLLERLAQGTGNLSYSSYCTGRLPSVGTENSFLVPGGIILFKTSLLAYILDGKINKKHHLYVQIKSSGILQCW